jgi:hypothetical protein
MSRSFASGFCPSAGWKRVSFGVASRVHLKAVQAGLQPRDVPGQELVELLPRIRVKGADDAHRLVGRGIVATDRVSLMFL